MIKYGTLPENINLLLPDAREYLNKHPKVVFAYLFGGLARGKVLPLSDVDIAIYMAEDAEIAQEKLEILGKLNEFLKTDEVDLVVLNTATLPLAARIIKNKIILVDKMPFTRHAFESLIMREYFDFSRKEMDIFERRYKLG
ncbi:MAG: nucleotidyltransferase domain-containing protein [Candidatus Brocadiales bacterium]|uniref:type VII toxin-antitoxin system MntA family adenylyltransferase antitoxin n=1 Tax=Candidatus Wunengus sp. YC60 TaxID=3367697 RepID=UPI0027124E16|nr:nucleotidyltransferase domain-containing protein [Candidatus Brocadiales bacterium]